MKILMVNKFLYPRGGSESYMLALGEQLSRLGHTVEYFGMYDEQNTVGNSLQLYTENMDFHSNRPGRYLYPYKIIYSIEAKRKIGRVLDAFQPDVVHMNNINFQLTPSIIDAVKKRNIPLVQTVHDYQMICPNHLLYSFAEHKPCERCLNGSLWNCVKHSCIHNSKVKSLLGVLEAKLYGALKTYQKVDLFLCPSRFLEQKLLLTKDFYQNKTFAIHNFIEKKVPVSEEKKVPDYFVFVGRFSREKGVELLAETAKLLPEYQFVAAGSGPDEAVLHDIPNLHLPGFLTGEALTRLMVNAKLLIAPSVCYENCPLSVLEALSLGVPVVTMQYGGMAELIEDGVTGTLVASPQPEAIAEAIRKTVENPEYYRELKANCEKEFEKIQDVGSYCEELLERYQQLTERGKPYVRA